MKSYLKYENHLISLSTFIIIILRVTKPLWTNNVIIFNSDEENFLLLKYIMVLEIINADKGYFMETNILYILL